MQLQRKQKGKQKIGSTLKGIGHLYGQTGRNGLKIGDLATDNFKDKYNKLKKDKHIQILKFYDFDYNLDEIEKVVALLQHYLILNILIAKIIFMRL